MTGPVLAAMFIIVTLGLWQVPSVPIVPAGFERQLRHLATSATAVRVVSVSAVAIGLLVWPVATGLVGLGAMGRRRFRRRMLANRAQVAATSALPISLELCIVTLAAGGTIGDCLRTLAVHGEEPTRSVAARTLQDTAAGALLDDALRSFQADLGPTFQPLTGALRLAWEQGGSVGALLDRLAIEANAGRRRSGDLRARRLPVLLLIPLIAFSLPAVILGAVVPLALVALRQVS